MNEEKLINIFTTNMSADLYNRLTKNDDEESSEVIIEHKLRSEYPDGNDIISLANKLYWLDRNFGGVKGCAHIIYQDGYKLRCHPKLSPDQADKYRLIEQE